MKKENREIVCILCPMSCKISVEIDDSEVVKVENSGCKLGQDYSIQEIKFPMRDFFSTVRVEGGRIPVLSVRSTKPVPKNMLKTCASELAKIVVPAPIRLGDMIVENILNLGVDIVATKSVEKA